MHWNGLFYGLQQTGNCSQIGSLLKTVNNTLQTSLHFCNLFLFKNLKIRKLTKKKKIKKSEDSSDLTKIIHLLTSHFKKLVDHLYMTSKCVF